MQTIYQNISTDSIYQTTTKKEVETVDSRQPVALGTSSQPGWTVRSSRRLRAWKSHQWNRAPPKSSGTRETCWSGQSLVASNYGINDSCYDSGSDVRKFEESWGGKVEDSLLNHVSPIFPDTRRTPSAFTSEWTVPSRNKIPRSQNRLMWQSGFTVTAGRPFRVGRQTVNANLFELLLAGGDMKCLAQTCKKSKSVYKSWTQDGLKQLLPRSKLYEWHAFFCST